MLHIHHLHVEIEGKPILKGVELDVQAGQVHVIMGPNGAGKSTLAATLAGRPDCEVTAGEVALAGQDILSLEPEERAAAGLFLAFQYPAALPGVGTKSFLKTALNAIRTQRGEAPLDAVQFLQLLKEKQALLQLPDDLLKRSVNDGFSGGEKKRLEIFQMALLNPKLALLDETDSGLDIDALRTIGQGVQQLRRSDNAILIITHYPRLLAYIQPDRVHVLEQGAITRSGDYELALELEKTGYEQT